MDVFNWVRVSVQVCVCEEKEGRKERTKGGQVKDERENQDPDQRTESSPRGNSAQMLTDYYHNHLFQMVWQWWWGFNADMCACSCFTIFQF